MPDTSELLETFQTFGDLLKYLRRRAQLTQSELSIAVGYSISQVSRLEHNLRAPDRASLLALFVPALDLQDEHETIRRLLELAQLNRSSSPHASELAPSIEVRLIESERLSIPTGVVTFLFTDIQGSVGLWEREPQAMQAALEVHNEILRNAIGENKGVVFKFIGDSFQAAFALPAQALRAALQAQFGLAEASWGKTGALQVRMGLHSGPAEPREGDYAVSHVLNRAGRVMAAGHGGQILLSALTADLLRCQLPEAVQLLDLGEFRLKGLLQPERIFQVIVPGLPRTFPPLNTESARHNLPFRLNRFIGREKELIRIKQLFASGCRLVTISGPGGCGKTRLALEAGEVLADAYPQGVWLVELATLADPAVVTQAVTSALGLLPTSSRPLLELLVEYLSARRILILLDNCEHVIEAASRLAENLLRACPQIHILATSREPLGVPGETVLRVPQLSLPPEGDLLDFHAVEDCEAVQLFVERARSANADFTVADDQVAALVRICRRLDGLPLAIELAAARTGVLSLEQIAGRLDQSLSLLVHGPRSADQRHRTLQAAIDWGFNLLSEPERTLLRRLAVFADGCSLDTAAQVCAWGSLAAGDILELLAALADKSLVMVLTTGSRDKGYRLLEVIRQYLLIKLVEAGEAAETRARCVAAYVNLAQIAEPALRGQQQLIWLKRLDQEYGNLRAALSLAVSAADALSALQLASALGWYWDLRGYHREGLHWLEAALSLDQENMPTAFRAKALLSAGILEIKLGELAKAAAHLEESRSIYEVIGDTNGIAQVLNNLAVLSWHLGDPAKTFVLLEQSLSILKESGDPLVRAEALFYTAKNNRWHLEDMAAARALLEQSIALAQAAGDRIFLALLNNDLAWYDWDRGELRAAQEKLSENIAICRMCGDLQTLYWSLSIQAFIATYQCRFQIAQESLVEMGSLAESMVNWNLIANARQQTGLLHYFMGDIASAQAELEAAISLYRSYSPSGAGWALSKLGDVLAVCGDVRKSKDLQDESMVMLEAQYSQNQMPWALRGLGNSALALGDILQAKAAYQRGLEMVCKRRTIPDIAYFLEPLAQVAVHEGDLRRAARLLGASQALRQQIGIPGPPVERAGIENCRNLLEQALSLDDFTRELTAGESLNAEKAVELALEGWQGSAAISDILSG